MEQQNRHQEEQKNQLLDALALEGKGFLDDDPVGLPDEKDIVNIKVIIRNYEVSRPGEIAAFVKQARKDKELADNDFGSSQDKSKRRVLTMPIGLLRQIEAAYPLMFKNRRHLKWFVDNFRGFNTHKRY